MDEDRALKIPSGSPVFDSRVHWAVTYMTQAGLIWRPRRAVVELTARRREVLAENPAVVDNVLLSRFPEFLDFKMRARDRQPSHPVGDAALSAESSEKGTPREQASQAVEEANAAVAAELLERIRARDPAFLEQLVLSLLTAMGYGGRAGAAEHLGRSGDQGLDGVIRQDALGLDRVYVQAKRYGADQSVGPTFRPLWGRCTAHKLIGESSSPRAGSRPRRATTRSRCQLGSCLLMAHS